MKKDNRLQDVFNDYFESSKAPNENLLNAAKNSMESPRTAVTPTPVWKRALVSAACAISALLSAVGTAFFPSAVGGIIAGIESGNKNQADAPTNAFTYYSNSDLYSDSLLTDGSQTPKGMDFVDNMLLARNCTVNSFDGYYADGELKYAEADVSLSYNSTRHETKIYAEYTPSNSACDIFRDYYEDGTVRYYSDNKVLFSSEQIDGEYVSKMCVTKDDVKYYISVTSSDQYAFRNYLKIILD